jgi:WD40 repeat protein
MEWDGGELLAILTADGLVVVINATDWRTAASLPTQKLGRLTVLAWQPRPRPKLFAPHEPRQLFVGGADGRGTFGTIDRDPSPSRRDGGWRELHQDQLCAGGISSASWRRPTGRLLAIACGRERRVLMVEVLPGLQPPGGKGDERPPSWRVRKELSGLHSSRISSTAFSPDGRLLAIGSWDASVSVVNGSTWMPLEGRLSLRLPSTPPYPASRGFMPDGVAAVGWAETTATHGPLLAASANDHTVTVVELIRPSMLAGDGADRTVAELRLEPGPGRRVSDGRVVGVSALAFSPNGDYAASAAADGRGELIDLRQSVHPQGRARGGRERASACEAGPTAGDRAVGDRSAVLAADELTGRGDAGGGGGARRARHPGGQARREAARGKDGKDPPGGGGDGKAQGAPLLPHHGPAHRDPSEASQASRGQQSVCDLRTRWGDCAEAWGDVRAANQPRLRPASAQAQPRAR